MSDTLIMHNNKLIITFFANTFNNRFLSILLIHCCSITKYTIILICNNEWTMAAYQTILWKVEVTKSEACRNWALQSQPILIKVAIVLLNWLSIFSEFKHKSDYENSYPFKQAAFDVAGSFTFIHSTVPLSFGGKKSTYPTIFFSCWVL